MIINLREVTSSQVSQNIVLSTPSLLDVKSFCVGMCAKIDEVPQESRHGWGNGGLCICYDRTALISWDLCWGTISKEGNQRGKLAANPESSFTDLSLGLWSHGQCCDVLKLPSHPGVMPWSAWEWFRCRWRSSNLNRQLNMLAFYTCAMLML